MSMPTVPSKPAGPVGSSPLGRRVRILIVDGDARAAGAVADILRAENWDVAWAHTGTTALERVRNEWPDAILTEMNLADMDGPSLCRALQEHSETASTPIMVLSGSTNVADRVAALRAGASDYMVKPPDPHELVARLQAALDLRRARSGFVIVVVGPKGGVGASMLAANLAVALRQVTRAEVAIADLARNGCQDVLLNLQARQGVADLLERLAEIEPGDLDGILTPHATGLQALLLGADETGNLQADQVRKVLAALRRSRDIVVVDTSARPREALAGALELADRLLLVLTPEITTLRETTRVVRQAEQLGLARERMVLVLNRSPLRGGLQRQDIQNAVGLPVRCEIPHDASLFAYSANRGVPLVLSHPRNGISSRIVTLAKSLAQAAGSR